MDKVVVRRAAMALREGQIANPGSGISAMVPRTLLKAEKPISQARTNRETPADLWRYSAALACTLHGDGYNSLDLATLGLVLKEDAVVVSIIALWLQSDAGGCALRHAQHRTRPWRSRRFSPEPARGH